MILVNTVTPFLQIYVPATGEFVRFQGGKLEIEKEDPHFAVVMAEAQRNPNISIIVNETTCPQCGEVFEGKAARAALGKHRKETHFAEWLADKESKDAESAQREVKARAGFACDVCQPVQTFGDEAGLAQHVKDIHTAPPELDDAGNEVGAGKSTKADTKVPAATKSKKPG